MLRISFAVVAWIALVDVAQAQYLAAELRSISGLGAAPGSACEIRTQGDRLDEVGELRFSHPGIVASVGKSDPLPYSVEPVIRYGEFTVNVGSDVPIGRYDVRTVGRHGLSNPRTFYVSPLPVTPVSSVSHDVKTPTPAALGSIVMATTTNATLDYFLVELAEPKRLKVDLLAQSLDTRVIGYLQVFDQSGREVAASRGGDQFDPGLVTDELMAGSYVIAVNDFLYRGGAEFGYALALQDATTAVSLGCEHSRAPESFSIGELSAESELPDLEQSPPEEPGSVPFSIEPPMQGTYWFPKDASEIVFELENKQASSWVLDVRSQRLGQPTDARLRVQRLDATDANAPKWVDVATADDMHELGDGVLSLRSRDASILLAASEATQYRIAARDLDIGRSLTAKQWFALNVRDPNPGFDVAAYLPYPNRDLKTARPHGNKLARGGAIMVRVFVSRRDGWTGAVHVSIPDLPADLQCNPIVVAGNQSRGDLVVTAGEEAIDGITTLNIVATSEDQSLRSLAVPVVLQQARDTVRDFVLSRRSESIDVAVSAVDLSPLTLQLADANVIEVKQGAAAKLPLRLTRRAGGAAAATVRPVQLLPGATCPDVAVAADASEAEITLQTTANTPLDTYSFCVEAETKVKVAPNPQLLAREQARKASLEAMMNQPEYSEKKESLQAEIAATAKRIEAAQASAKEQELTVFLPSSTITLRVLAP